MLSSMSAKDEWVSAAMADDMVVVEQLLSLKQTQGASASPKSQSLTGSNVLLSWGLKQPRSKTALLACRFDGAVSRRKDDADSIRFSPSTPFSWSGGASPSATTDGFEESSRPLHSSRSKATAIGKRDSNIANTKSSRRRKEVDNLHSPVKARKAANQRLKRMKLDFVQDAQEKAKVETHFADPAPSSSCDTRQTNSTQESSFLLPDLNMMPSEDGSPSQTLLE